MENPPRRADDSARDLRAQSRTLAIGASGYRRMINGGKHNVLGVSVDVIDYESAVDQIIRAAKDRRSFAVTALAVHGVMTGAMDSEQRFRLNQFDLAVPDGQPVRWALNLLHSAHLSERVYGPTLMLEVCERCEKEALPIYLYGSSSD